jgi:peptidyl-prolyl cis-trans isomerase SurA
MKIITRIVLGISLIINFSLTNAQDGIVIDGVVAVVGQKMIMKSDVESQLMQMKAQNIKIGDNTRCEIFESILFQTLLLNQSEIDSIEVSETQVEGELERRLSLFEDQMGGRTQLEDYYGKPYSEIKNHFRDVVRDQMKTQRMQGEITQNVKVTPEQVNDFFNKIPKDSLPLIESQIEIAQIVIYPIIKKSQTDKIINEMEGYKKRVENGEDFQMLAGLYSDDVASAQEGGELGWVKRGDLVPEFSEAAFALENSGDLSGIIKTDFGYHLIQFVERKGSKILVRHILRVPKALASENLAAKNDLDSIATLIRENKITFELAAKKYSTDDDSNKNGGILTNPYTGMSKFEASQLDPATNYIIKQLKVGEISDPYESKNMKGKTEMKIIMVVSKTEAHIANIKTDYQKISDMALEAQKNITVDKWISEKQKTTFIKIYDDNKNCKFKYSGWLK